MNWADIKYNIITELNSKKRDLADPRIRTNSLVGIESKIGILIQSNPELLLKIGKEDLLKSLNKLKKLNSAEKSIINHIYDVLEGKQIPIRKKNRL